MALNDELRDALDHVASGRWERAHAIVQEHEEDDVACWIHALVHRIEGDTGNASYWYRRAGKPAGDHPTDVEVARIRAALDARGG